MNTSTVKQQNATLYIKSSPNCLKLMKYISKNIKLINDMGVYINIIKYSEDDFDINLINYLKRKKIEYLPALVLNNSKPIMGVDKIISIFEKNIKRFKNERKQTEINNTFNHSDLTLEEFYQKEINIKDREEDDETLDEGINNTDLTRRIQEMKSRYNIGKKNEQPFERLNNMSLSNNSTGPRTTHEKYQSEQVEDNISSTKDFKSIINDINKTSEGPQNIDSMMQRSWLENNFDYGNDF